MSFDGDVPGLQEQPDEPKKERNDETNDLG